MTGSSSKESGRTVKRRKKVCPVCGRKLWLRNFYRRKNGSLFDRCIECEKKYAKGLYMVTKKKPNGVFVGKDGRLREHKDTSTKIYWSPNMLAIMRRYFPITKTQELVEILGVSMRTIIRKARELDLEKSEDFLKDVRNDNRLLAWARAKQLGNPGTFQKGRQFTGNQYTGKIQAKQKDDNSEEPV